MDFAYYLNLCRGYKTIDMFSGFGRVANYLNSMDVDIEAVELEKEFAKFIQLPKKKKHVCDVLEFSTEKKYDRIIAPFNSFCLLINEIDIANFFKIINLISAPEAVISLSYYHHDFWPEACDGIDYFNYKGCNVEHESRFDLSRRAERAGIWTDIYNYNNETYQFDYPVCLYESENDLHQFIKGTDLKIIEVIRDFNKKDLEYPGWLEFILTKS